MSNVIMLFIILNGNGDVVYNDHKDFILDMKTCVEAISGTKEYLENYSRVYQNEEIHVSIKCEWK